MASSRSRILIVAGDNHLRELMQDSLRECFDTAVAGDVLACTDLLLGNEYDLLVLDDQLPVVPGREYMEMLEASAEFPSLPVVIVSAAPDLEQKIKSKHNRGFLPNPFRLDQLFGQIQTLLQPHPLEL